MAFKYLNPGYKDLFDIVSDKALETLSTKYSRTSGKSFSFRSGEEKSLLHIETANEYWAAFYIYTETNAGSYTHLVFNIYNKASSKGIALVREKLSNKFSLYNNDSELIISTNQSLAINNGYHIEIHIKNNETNTIIELWINGKKEIEYIQETVYEMFDEIYFGGETNNSNTVYFSDIVIQNTGRIGDIRVNILPVSNTNCEWEKVKLPIGHCPSGSTSYFGGNKSCILYKQAINITGKIHTVFIYPRNKNTINIKFFLLRKNNATGKYNPVEVSEIYTVNSESWKEINLTSPINVQIGDFLGYYADGEFYTTNNTGHDGFGYYNDDITSETELSMPNYTDNRDVYIYALLTPDDINKGMKFLSELMEKDLETAKQARVETTETEKIITNTVKNKTSIGRIENISIIGYANYEGESASKSIAGIIKSGEQISESEKSKVTIANSMYTFASYNKNPLTNAEWQAEELENMQFGIKSKE